MSVVRNTFLSQMIGCENPLPGSAVFHNTFFVSLHSAGRFLSFETPWLSGPRHCGQLDELAASPLEIRAASNDNRQMNEKDESLIASRFIDLRSPYQNLERLVIFSAHTIEIRSGSISPPSVSSHSHRQCRKCG